MPDQTSSQPASLVPTRSVRLQAWPKPMVWVCYGVLAGIMAYVVVVGWLRPLWLDEPVQVVAGAHVTVELKIDPNVADWPELCLLPQIGPATAKRIIAYRAQQRAAGVQAPVFRCLDDLDAIRGIGLKTLESIGPFLTFPNDVSAPAGQTKADAL